MEFRHFLLSLLVFCSAWASGPVSARLYEVESLPFGNFEVSVDAVGSSSASLSIASDGCEDDDFIAVGDSWFTACEFVNITLDSVHYEGPGSSHNYANLLIYYNRPEYLYDNPSFQMHEGGVLTFEGCSLTADVIGSSTVSLTEVAEGCDDNDFWNQGFYELSCCELDKFTVGTFNFVDAGSPENWVEISIYDSENKLWGGGDIGGSFGLDFEVLAVNPKNVTYLVAGENDSFTTEYGEGTDFESGGTSYTIYYNDIKGRYANVTIVEHGTEFNLVNPEPEEPGPEEQNCSSTCHLLGSYECCFGCLTDLDVGECMDVEGVRVNFTSYDSGIVEFSFPDSGGESAYFKVEENQVILYEDEFLEGENVLNDVGFYIGSVSAEKIRMAVLEALKIISVNGYSGGSQPARLYPKIPFVIDDYVYSYQKVYVLENSVWKVYKEFRWWSKSDYLGQRDNEHADRFPDSQNSFNFSNGIGISITGSGATDGLSYVSISWKKFEQPEEPEEPTDGTEEPSGVVLHEGESTEVGEMTVTVDTVGSTTAVLTVSGTDCSDSDFVSVEDVWEACNMYIYVEMTHYVTAHSPENYASLIIEYEEETVEPEPEEPGPGTTEPQSEEEKFECETGCATSEETCVPAGTRMTVGVAELYCGTDEGWHVQKRLGEKCDNSYECATNFCTNGECYNIAGEVQETRGLLQMIIDFLRRLFGLA